MPAASILIKPASANCNMNCKYCFYKVLSSNREQYNLGFMTEDTLQRLVKEAVDYADGSLTFAFQGGEPTLIGLDFYKKAVDLQKEYGSKKKGLRIENTLQTNGTILNDQWCDFFRQENFLIGLSLDGPKKGHNQARLFADESGTFDQVMSAAALLKKHQVDFNILTVVTENLSQKASALYHFYKRNQFPYVQLIPCMDELRRNDDESENCSVNPYAITAKSYGQFLCEFFDLWYEDFMEWHRNGRRGYVMDVRMFSNLAQMTIGYPPEECGMNGFCSCYFVVEGDGSVYPCDFYCMDQWKLGSVGTPFIELLQSQKAAEFLKRGRISATSQCISCNFNSLCRGGCRRFREVDKSGEDTNFLCEGYKQFYSHTWERLHILGNTIQ